MSWFGIIRTGASEMNKSQKDFEKFANHWRYDLTLTEEGYYSNTLTQHAWNAWEASRAALVVELPDVCDLHPRKMLESEVIKRLEKAGVKYK